MGWLRALAHAVPARDLRRYFGINTDTEIPTAGLADLASARTLRQFTDDLAACRVGRRIDPLASGGPSGSDDSPGPDRDRELDGWAQERLADTRRAVMTLIVAHVPARDLPNFGFCG